MEHPGRIVKIWEWCHGPFDIDEVQVYEYDNKIVVLYPAGDDPGPG
jgi:hypothetical protein